MGGGGERERERKEESKWAQTLCYLSVWCVYACVYVCVIVITKWQIGSIPFMKFVVNLPLSIDIDPLLLHPFTPPPSATPEEFQHIGLINKPT